MDLNGVEIKYSLRRVPSGRNINLRVSRKDGIVVNAYIGATTEQIESYIRSNADGILASLKKYDILERDDPKIRTAEAFHQLVNKYVYKYYYIMKASHEMPDFPTIRFRVMKTRWGICNNEKCELAFNSQLAAKPREAIEYVVVHELSHFTVQGHTKPFYEEIERFMPDWKIKRKMLQQEWNPGKDEE